MGHGLAVVVDGRAERSDGGGCGGGGGGSDSVSGDGDGDCWDVTSVVASVGAGDGVKRKLRRLRRDRLLRARVGDVFELWTASIDHWSSEDV